MTEFNEKLQDLRTNMETMINSLGDMAAELDDIGTRKINAVEEYCMKMSTDLQDIQAELEDGIDTLDDLQRSFIEEEEPEEVGRPLYGTEALQSLSNRLAAIERYLGVKALDT